MQSTKDRTQIHFTVNTIHCSWITNNEFIKFHLNIIYKCFSLHLSNNLYTLSSGLIFSDL